MNCLLENLPLATDYLLFELENIFSCKTLMRNESNTSRSKDCLLFVPDAGLDPEEPCI